MLIVILLAVLEISPVYSFIVGGCIGPKSVLERHLSEDQKKELRRLVHTQFDGSNADQVLTMSNGFVHQLITPEQWQSILPELKAYQTRKHECSIYAQLLPKETYRNLLKSVYRASEMGASRHDVKRLVDDYVDRLVKSGALEKAPSTPSPLPKSGYRVRAIRPTTVAPDENVYHQRYTIIDSGRYDRFGTTTITPHRPYHPYPGSNVIRLPQPEPQRLLPPVFPIVRPFRFNRQPFNSPTLHG